MTESRIDEGRADLIAWERSKPGSFFESDFNFQEVLRTRLGDRYAALEPELIRTGALAATRGDQAARLCNRDENLPVLRSWTGVGERTDEIVFNPAHHEVGAIFWGSGALAVLGEPQSEVMSGALLYLLDHLGEAGHACPMACTGGLIKLLQQVGTEEQRARYLPPLLQRDYSKRLYASQFVTEVQGGSDVGANDCQAVPDPERPGSYRLSGEKWFCSVIDAPLFVMTARVPGGRPGTAGLGLFLAPRSLDDGRPNGLRVRRLKYKLGTRSMASGEADFDRALCQPLGPVEQGFKHLIGIVLDTSRVHNAVAAAGFMRRAYVEAQTFAQHRRAFGRRIGSFPAIQRILARMRVQGCAALASTFRILALGDRLAARADAELASARRMHVNLNKYGTALACTEVVRSGIEVLGGNGTIEDFSVLPRLYRDSMVLESWEGSHNTLCAQILRDSAQRGLHRPWLAEVGSALEGLRRPELQAHRDRAVRLHAEVGQRIGRLVEGGADYAERHIRQVVDRMQVLSSYLALLEELQAELGRGQADEKADLVELYYRLFVEPVDPMSSPELGELEERVSARL